MKEYLAASAVTFIFLGFFGFFVGAMTVETMPTETMIRAFGACAVSMAGGLLCMKMWEMER